jgi:hypothetical protein
VERGIGFLERGQFYDIAMSSPPSWWVFWDRGVCLVYWLTLEPKLDKTIE